MMTVQDDWIQYEAVPARRVAVRGGSACAQRSPVVRQRDRRPAPAVPVRVGGRSGTRESRTPVRSPRVRLRLTRRGRLVLVVLPALSLLLGAGIAAGAGTAQALPVPVSVPVPVPVPGVDREAVVAPGDAPWSAAGRAVPGSHRRDVISRRDAGRLPGE